MNFYQIPQQLYIDQPQSQCVMFHSKQNGRVHRPFVYAQQAWVRRYAGLDRHTTAQYYKSWKIGDPVKSHQDDDLGDGHKEGCQTNELQELGKKRPRGTIVYCKPYSLEISTPEGSQNRDDSTNKARQKRNNNNIFTFQSQSQYEGSSSRIPSSSDHTSDQSSTTTTSTSASINSNQANDSPTSKAQNSSFVHNIGLSEDIEKSRRRLGGIFYNATTIPLPEQIKGIAERSVRNIGFYTGLQRNDKIKNKAKRQIAAFSNTVGNVVGISLCELPSLEQLLPYELELLQLTVGVNRYLRCLSAVQHFRQIILSRGDKLSAQIDKNNAPAHVEKSKKEADEIMAQVFEQGVDHIAKLRQITVALKQIPVLDPLVPTVALVGAPNVGKSSIVRQLSSGRPEVCNYPFTTRSLSMGHFYIDGLPHQVTDTPGLLDRPDEERNVMERLTLAVLRHLPVLSIFVVDLTGQCGCSVKQQWAIREYLRAEFPHLAWVDVVSKHDQLDGVQEAARELAKINLSAYQVWELPGITQSIKMASLLPNALWVSSISSYGIDDLRQELMNMMTKQEVIKNIVKFNIDLNNFEEKSKQIFEEKKVKLKLRALPLSNKKKKSRR